MQRKYGFLAPLPIMCAVGALGAGCEPQTIEEERTGNTGAAEAPPVQRDQQQAAETGDAAQQPEAGAAGEPSAQGEAQQAAEAGEGAGQTAAGDEPQTARATLEPTQGNEANGTVRFVPQQNGMLMMVVNVRGLSPGMHAFHIHENGDCSAPDASSAGGHFAPDGDPHGSPEAAPGEHHAGDLGNIVADDAGAAETRLFDTELELQGRYGVVGKAAIVHVDRDDLTTQPDGGAGARVACGVIRSVQPGSDGGVG